MARSVHLRLAKLIINIVLKCSKKEMPKKKILKIKHRTFNSLLKSLIINLKINM